MLNFLQIKFLTTFSHRVTFFKQKCGEGKRIKNIETQRMNEKSEKKIESRDMNGMNVTKIFDNWPCLTTTMN